MRINNQNKTIDREYQREIKLKEDRIKEIKDNYNKKIQEIQEASDDEIGEKRKLEREKISGQLELENEKYEDIKKKWKEKNAVMENENLKEEIGMQQKLNINKLQYGQLMEQEQKKINGDINKMRERGNKSLREMQDDSSSKLYLEEIKSRNDIETIRKENENRKNLAINAYSETERENVAQLRNIKEENSRILNEREKINQENLKRMDELNKNKLSMAEKRNKQKIEQMQKESFQTINNLSSKAEKEINKIKQNESRDKKIIQERSNDPFYSITNLNPKLTNNEKEYILRLSVPEHEKDSVIVGGDGRNIKISQTRRYSDESKSENGTMSKSSRSEVVSQLIKLDEIINPRKITHSFMDNELVFKIPKA